MPSSLQLSRLTSLVDAVREPDDRPFVTMRDRAGRDETLTFDAFAARSRSFASGYARAGLRPTDRVVLIMPQGIDLMAAFVGAMQIGAVPAILAYPTFKVDPEKYRHGLRGSTRNLSAAAVIVDAELPPELLDCIRSGDAGVRILCADSMDAEAATDRPSYAPAENAIAFIQHSGGTTGLQKAVALSHSAVLNQLRRLARALSVSGEDRIASWLPLYHDMGLIACFMLPLAARLRLVMQSPTDWVLRPGSFLRMATEHRCTLCWLPNFALQFMARRVPAAERDALDLRAMRAWINCSEPVRAASVDEFHRAYAAAGVTSRSLHGCYAMAENTFAVTQTSLDRAANRSIAVDRSLLQTEAIVRLVPPDHPDAAALVSSGACLDGTSIRIATPTGGDAGDAKAGDIWIRSDSLFDGYFNRPDLTRRALCQGWYRTGDVGFTLDGELYVLGRRDDVIIVAGENIHPEDVEEIACAHPAIRDGRAVAFGLFNPSRGTDDLIVIAEVAAASYLDHREEIESVVRRAVLGAVGVAPRMARLVAPGWIVKNTAGKPARAGTRRRFLSEHPELDPDPQHTQEV